MTGPPTRLHLPARRPNRLGLLVLGLLFAVIVVLPAVVQLAAEWPWFGALGYQRVFATRLVTQVLLGGVTGGGAFAFLYANLRVAQRGVVPNPLVLAFSTAAPALDVTRLLRRLALPAALGLGLLSCVGATGTWLSLPQFLQRTQF